MGQAQQTRGAVLIVEDDAELRSLTVALLEDEQLDTIECESAEAALAVMLIGGQHVALIFADIRLCGVMDGIDLAHEVRVRSTLCRLGIDARIVSAAYPCSFECPPSREWFEDKPRRISSGSTWRATNGRNSTRPTNCRP